jgi:hypothetical protein
MALGCLSTIGMIKPQSRQLIGLPPWFETRSFAALRAERIQSSS